MRRLALLIALGLVLGWAVAASVLIAWPREESPGRADAVVVLSGDDGPRLRRGLGLVRRGVAPVLVISSGMEITWPEANRLCAGRETAFEVLCFDAEPYSTRGEARGVAQLAVERGWRSIAVVTSEYHVTRARMIFERCLDGDVAAVGAPYAAGLIPYALVSETAKLGYALAVVRGC